MVLEPLIKVTVSLFVFLGMLLVVRWIIVFLMNKRKTEEEKYKSSWLGGILGCTLGWMYSLIGSSVIYVTYYAFSFGSESFNKFIGESVVMNLTDKILRVIF